MAKETNSIPEGFTTSKNLTNNGLVSQSILTNQLALVLNERIKHTPHYNSTLKYRLNNTIDELIKLEQKGYDKLFDQHETSVKQFYDETAEMMEEVANLGLHHIKNITEMLRAFQKDPSSIAGIVNKINRK